MARENRDVVGFGSAVVDYTVFACDSQLAALGLEKGVMTPVDRERAAFLRERITVPAPAAGGSVANTVATLPLLGGRAGFVGHFGRDRAGELFRRQMEKMAVATAGEHEPEDGSETAFCMILVTPDGQRTMATFPGAALHVSDRDIEPELVASGRIFFAECYLLDAPGGERAMTEGMAIARGAGRMTALSLSDPRCVERHRDGIGRLAAGGIDILVANEHEAAALSGTPPAGGVPDCLRSCFGTVALTRSEKGSILARAGETVDIPPVPVADPVSSVGAGDLYAAGLLFGLARNFPLARAGRLGSLCASACLGQREGRLSGNQEHLVAQCL